MTGFLCPDSGELVADLSGVVSWQCKHWPRVGQVYSSWSDASSGRGRSRWEREVDQSSPTEFEWTKVLMCPGTFSAAAGVQIPISSKRAANAPIRSWPFWWAILWALQSWGLALWLDFSSNSLWKLPRGTVQKVSDHPIISSPRRGMSPGPSFLARGWLASSAAPARQWRLAKPRLWRVTFDLCAALHAARA